MDDDIMTVRHVFAQTLTALNLAVQSGNFLVRG